MDTIRTLAHVAFSFSVHMLSTDLRAVSMTCDLRTEQTKRYRGKKYERREGQRIRSETRADHDARAVL